MTLIRTFGSFLGLTLTRSVEEMDRVIIKRAEVDDNYRPIDGIL